MKLHEHETWMIDESASGGYYCRACGARVEDNLTDAERAYLARPPFTSDRTLNYLVAVDLFGWDRAQRMYPPEVPTRRVRP